MRSTLLRVLLAVTGATAAVAAATASERPAARWIEREFVDPNGVATAAATAFLTDECRPADLSGISIFGVQTGHSEPVHLHVWCRPDRAAGVRYEVSVVSFPKGAYAAPVADALRRKARVGPFVFGLAGGPDGMVVLRRLDGPQKP